MSVVDDTRSCRSLSRPNLNGGQNPIGRRSGSEAGRARSRRRLPLYPAIGERSPAGVNRLFARPGERKRDAPAGARACVRFVAFLRAIANVPMAPYRERLETLGYAD